MLVDSFKRKIARANKKYEHMESSTSEEESSDGESSTQGRRKTKIVSFNDRIPRKRDTFQQENAAYNKAVKKAAEGEHNPHMFSDSDSTETE